MNISRFLLLAVFGCVLPAVAQPKAQPTNGLPYPLYSIEEAARVTGALKPISFRFNNISVGVAIRQLGAITGVKLNLNRSNLAITGKKIDVEANTVYFLEALNAILEKAGAQANLQTQKYNSIYSVQVDALDSHPLYGQPTFQIRAAKVEISSSKSIELGQTPRHNQSASLNVELKPVLDPRIPVIGSPYVQVTRANDDQGFSLQPDEPDEQIQNLREFSNQVQVRLKAPLPASQKIARLEGKLIYVVPTKYENWQVDDAFNPQSSFHDFQSNGEKVRVTLKHIQQTEWGVDLKLEVTSPRLKQLGQPFQTPFPVVDMAQTLTLKDANERNLYSSVTRSTGDTTKYTLEITASFSNTFAPPVRAGAFPQPHAPELTQPLSFSLKIPVEFIQTEIPFSFSNLPLP